jgi:predicted dienelactone hydrolase
MLFSRESLAAVSVPVAIVEAGSDSLYPPDRHSQPYFSNFPAIPLGLHLPESDHFSLFAVCSRDTLHTLGETCGRLTGDARQALSKKRDAFLVPFFQSVLGGPLPPAKPSGLAAAPDGDRR